MNKEGYAVKCTQCGSTNVQYDYAKTTFNSITTESKTPVKCLDCHYETEVTEKTSH